MPMIAPLGATFPAVDPIPLPAPVWLFKILLDLTLTLHFVALYLLLGGLLVAAVMNFLGHRAKDQAHVEASGTIAGWLPVIMTYVINLGVPPLLFAQVLYGRALYTSSVLIGAYWIAVIPLLIACYHLLYVAKARIADRQSFVWPLAGALLAAGMIARIYTANMSLMIQPMAWSDAYHADQSGTTLLTGRASWARWIYMLSAGIAATGVFAVWLSRGRAVTEAASRVLRKSAVPLILGGSILAIAAGLLAWGGQTAAVRDLCSSGSASWIVAVGVWGIGLIGVVIFASILALSDGPARWTLPLTGSAAVVLQTAGFVVCRDLVSDAALTTAGFNVWERATFVNWSVLGLFLVLFVAGLGVVGWLASVAYRTTPAAGDVR